MLGVSHCAKCTFCRVPHPLTAGWERSRKKYVVPGIRSCTVKFVPSDVCSANGREFYGVHEKKKKCGGLILCMCVCGCITHFMRKIQVDIQKLQSLGYLNHTLHVVFCLEVMSLQECR